MTVPLPPPNSIYWDEPYLCNYTTCPLIPFGQIQYRPTLAGNALFLAIFVLGLICCVGLSIRYRTWGYLVAIIGGTALEIVGYLGRILLWQDDFNNNNFIIYLVGLTIGPAFFSAAIYLCLARIISIYGHTLPWFTPKTITIFFVGCDLMSLILQAAGGAIASTANTHSATQAGINIMIAGLSTQVASMVAFVIVCGQLALAIRRHPEKINTEYAEMRQSKRFRFFLCSIGVCTIAILIRCSYRVAELSDGFNGSIANNEVEFMILDGMLMSIVIILLTVAHPGFILGPMWKAGGFHLRGSKNAVRKETGSASSAEPGAWGPGATTETDQEK